MCGRTAMNFGEDDLRAELARANVQVNQVNNQPVWRQTHNVAPTYNQPVIRQLGERHDQIQDNETVVTDAEKTSTHNLRASSTAQPGDLIVQSMRWGLIPFWTKRAPDYSSIARTINCRDDSLSANTPGVWTAIKGTKRCVVPVMGYYEWLKKSNKERIPYFTKRADGKIMLLAGLWDSVKYEGSDERIYTYTIVTTDAAKNVAFLHDRMPVILEPDSIEFQKWLDPKEPWSIELEKILKPYEGKLECYPVKKEVGKVGQDSPLFILPLDSVENKSNIVNFFVKSPPGKETASKRPIGEVLAESSTGDASPKRKGTDVATQQRPPAIENKVRPIGRAGRSTVKAPPKKPSTKVGPAASNNSPIKKDSTSKITNFFNAM